MYSDEDRAQFGHSFPLSINEDIAICAFFGSEGDINVGYHALVYPDLSTM